LDVDWAKSFSQFFDFFNIFFVEKNGFFRSYVTLIRFLSAASAAKFNITPVRWQHPSHVAIVPTESKGKTEGNDWDTACGNLQT
jgi:hypothetical protein